MKTSGRFSKSRGLRASVPFFPLPHPLPSTFLLSPHFLCDPNVKFRLLRTGTLATQATRSLAPFPWKVIGNSAAGRGYGAEGKKKKWGAHIKPYFKREQKFQRHGGWKSKPALLCGILINQTLMLTVYTCSQLGSCYKSRQV